MIQPTKLNKKADELTEGQTISFNFNNRKGENKKKLSKPIFFDDE